MNAMEIFSWVVVICASYILLCVCVAFTYVMYAAFKKDKSEKKDKENDN